MSKIKFYTHSEALNKGSMVRLDAPLFVAVMTEAVKQGLPSYADYVRSLLAAVCLDKTYGKLNEEGTLIAGNTYYTESDIKVYESQIESLKKQLSESAIELRNREFAIQNLREQHQVQIVQLQAKIPPNLGQNLPNLPNLDVFEAEIPSNLGNYNRENQPNLGNSYQSQQHQNQPPITSNQNHAGTNQNQFGINQNQSGIELSEFGINKPIPETIPLNMEQIIQDKFLEVVGNELVVEYFNQQTKLNQSFGISGFSGTFQVVEEIPNSLLEHHPLVIYWKKQVGQFENAVVNATEAFFAKDKTVQQMNQNEQMALVALMKREQMLWWLITHFTTIRGFDGKYFEYLMNTVKTQCQGFPVMANPYHENILNANNQPYYGEQ